MVLTVPIPPSGNKMWRHTKFGKVYKTPECKAYQEQVGYMAQVEARHQGWQMTQKEKVIIMLKYYWPDNRNRDTGNVIKVLLDGLEGVLFDNDRYVLTRDLDWVIDRENPRIEMQLIKF